MNLLNKHFQNINPIKNTLVYKLLKGMHPQSNLSDTILLFQHLKDKNIVENINQTTFQSLSDYDTLNEQILVSNVGIDIIQDFIKFSYSLKSTNIQNNDILLNAENYKKYVKFIQEDISKFNINHKLTKYYGSKSDIEKINNLINSEIDKKQYIDSDSINNKIASSQTQTLKLITYPIFSLLTPLSFDDVLDTLEFWLDNKVITKENFIEDFKTINFNEINMYNFITQQLNAKNWKNVFDTLTFMNVSFKDIPLLITKIDDVEIIKSIIEKENINPYEKFSHAEIKLNKSKIITSSLHILISQGQLMSKQGILEMFSKNNSSNVAFPTDVKVEEFFNMIESGANSIDLKNFMKVRDLNFENLITTKIQNKNIVDYIAKNSTWWLIPYLVNAENKILKKGESTSQIFAHFLHLPKDSKNSSVLFSRLNKCLTNDILINNYENFRVFYNTNNFNMQNIFISNKEYQQISNNLFSSISSIIPSPYPEDSKENLTGYDNIQHIRYDKYVNHTHSNSREIISNNSYYYIMYSIKNHCGDKNKFFTDVDKIEPSKYILFNMIELEKMNYLFTDYYFGSKIFPVSIENGEKMEGKIIDILSHIMYSVYKDNSENKQQVIACTLSFINYTLNILLENTQNIERLKYNIIINDNFNDKLLSFSETIQNFNLSIYNLEDIKEKLSNQAKNLYKKNLDFNLPVNNIETKAHKF